MQYGIIYRLSWNTVPSVLSAALTTPAQAMIVNIYDTLTLIDDADTPVVIQLQADAVPLVIRIINNDEDKFSPIRAKQATIQFKSNATQFQDTLTFADSPDNRWYVEITADGEFVFKGYLMMGDLQQDHLPDPNTVTLQASDHLALLRDIALTTDALVNPQGYFRLIDIIALCLKKTGLQLEIVTINNLRAGSGRLNPAEVLFLTDSGQPKLRLDDVYAAFFYVGQRIDVSGTVSNNTDFHVTDVVIVGSDVEVYVTEAIPSGESSLTAVLTDYASGHIYDTVQVNALTFEKEIGASEDCNTVLEKILGEDCFLTQWKGKWYIMRVDEFDGNPIYEAAFTYNGGFLGYNASTSYSKSLGAVESRRLANADALRRYDRPYGSIKEIFDFVFPSELPCNVDYVRGDETSDPDVQVTGYTSYELDCWTLGKGWGADSTSTTHKKAILRSFTVFGDELSRFIIQTMPTYDPPLISYIQSSEIPVGYKDRFKWSFDVATLTDPSGDGFIYICKVILYGVSGTVYTLYKKDSGAWNDTDGEVDTQWKITDEELSLFFATLRYNIYDDADHPPPTEWTTCVMNAAEVPEEGSIVIYLLASNQFATSHDDVTLKFQNLNFEYHAYIGGIYDRYIKYHNKVTRDPEGYFNAKRERSVYINDSPKPLFKGALFTYNGVRMVLTSRWYTAAPFYTSDPPASIGEPPDLTYLHPYGYIQAYSVWNQFRNGSRILAGSELGLGSMWPDALDKWSITDSNPHVNDRYFMLISFEQNWKTALWSGVFIEVYRTDIGKIYSDPEDFKYLTK